jgi:hypothetical protein
MGNLFLFFDRLSIPVGRHPKKVAAFFICPALAPIFAKK